MTRGEVTHHIFPRSHPVGLDRGLVGEAVGLDHGTERLLAVGRLEGAGDIPIATAGVSWTAVLVEGKQRERGRRKGWFLPGF